ncbi:PKD domain-containing protein [Parasediminibacterium paludis]|uniref:PKD domain-containing protein n=1 Tax=Parasediminibacterium paludis TaxID=908966 RepID=A0ABV8PSG2_9BACT
MPLSNVYILPVNVTYSVPTTGLTVNYSATATDNSGGTLSYSWNFNDGTGNTSSTASGAYTFAAAGTYNASLTVTSSKGGSATISPIVITVTNPAPVAKITAVDYSTPGNSAWSIYDASTISSGRIVNEVFEYTFTDLTTGISQPTLSYKIQEGLLSVYQLNLV